MFTKRLRRQHHSAGTHRRHRSANKNRRGATAVEFAMIAPVFFMVMAFCGEFARLSLMRNLAQNAAYEGARSVITEGMTVAEGIERANHILSRVGTSGAIVTINDSTGVPDENGVVENEIDFKTESVTCTVVIPLSQNSLIVPDAMFGDATITSHMTIRTERYRGYYDGVSTQ